VQIFLSHVRLVNRLMWDCETRMGARRLPSLEAAPKRITETERPLVCGSNLYRTNA